MGQRDRTIRTITVEPGAGAPGWVGELLGPSPLRESTHAGPVALTTLVGGGWALVTARIRDDGRTPADPDRERQDPSAPASGTPLARGARDVYAAIARTLREAGRPHPVRFWNAIPRINAPAATGDGDRYMEFNAGRYEAFTGWLERDPRKGEGLPTATCVGHGGSDLVVICLAADRPARQVENPRQRPAYRYSSRYGILPPCFARATVLPARSAGRPGMILVGGTASVRGEDSAHPGDLARQLDETKTNMAHLVRAARAATAVETDSPLREPDATRAGGHDLRGVPAVAARTGAGGPLGVDTLDCLGLYRTLRVHFPNPADLREILADVAASFPGVREVELMRADLCRPELLVEIEGVAAPS